MKSLLLLTVLAGSFNAFAFNRVNEVLPDGKVLLCRQADQVREGDKVSVYRVSDFSLKRDKNKVLSAEFNLPSEGAQMDVYRTNWIRKNKTITGATSEVVGSLTVISSDLTGEKRKKISYLYKQPRKEEIVDFTSTEVSEIKENCLVAKANGDLKISTGDFIKL